jgi:hypothetical protein
LVLGEEQGRTKVSLEIGERVSQELADYTRWVEKWSGIPSNDARFKTVDFALRELFRRDRVWQAEKRSPEPAKAAPVVTPSPAPRPTAATPPSLPPSAPREPRPPADGTRT